MNKLSSVPRPSFRCFLLVWILALSSYSNASAFSPLCTRTTTGARRCLSTSLPSLSTTPVWGKIRGGAQQPVSVDTADDATEPPVFSFKATTIPGLAAMGQMFTSMGKVYTQNLDKFPIITKSCTAGVIFGLSDFIAQKIEQKSQPVVNGTSKKKDAAASAAKSMDWTRLIASTLVGLLYFGPAAHYWYEMIFRLLPGTSMASTLQKAFWGQVLFGPSFNCIFFATSLLQAGKFSLGSWWQKIKSDLPGAWLAGAGFWPLVDVVSYSMIPVKWIPLFVNMCSLVWTIYLSIVANRDSKKQAK